MGNLWEKLKNWLLNLFGKEDIKRLEAGLEDVEEELNQANKESTISEENIKLNNSVIGKARNAYKNYNLQLDYEIGENIYNTIKERLEVNKNEIERLIDVRNEEFSYNDILKRFENCGEYLDNYKKTISSYKIDSNFILASFVVPIGIIGIESNDSLENIDNIFKAITTRNAIVIINEKEDDYTVEKLILLIVTEALKKFDVEPNLIQISNKKAVENKELFDLYITNNKEKIEKEHINKMYVYLENNYFKEEAEKELERLKDKDVEFIDSNTSFENAIERINKNKSYGVGIYIQDGKRAYEFINLVNSQNIFINGTLLNAKKIKENDNLYYTEKNILCPIMMA